MEASDRPLMEDRIQVILTLGKLRDEGRLKDMTIDEVFKETGKVSPNFNIGMLRRVLQRGKFVYTERRPAAAAPAAAPVELVAALARVELLEKELELVNGKLAGLNGKLASLTDRIVAAEAHISLLNAENRVGRS
jgi:hypothetical protein